MARWWIVWRGVSVKMLKGPFSRHAIAGTALIAALGAGAALAGDAPTAPPLALAALTGNAPDATSGAARQIDLGKLDLPKPDGAQKLDITYDVFIGGLHLATAELVATVDHGHYLAASAVSTKGLADAFASSQISAVATGEVRGHLVVPHTYNSDTLAPDKRQLVGLLYADGTPVDINSSPAYDLSRFPVPEDQKHGTVDPLSAALYIMLGSSASDTHKCGATVPVFDGKRRYNLTFDYKKDDTASLGRDYNGGKPVPAYLCTTNYVRVAGFKPHKKGHESSDVPSLDVWMAPYPGTSFIVPVRMQASTDFGGIVARASKLVVTPAG